MWGLEHGQSNSPREADSLSTQVLEIQKQLSLPGLELFQCFNFLNIEVQTHWRTCADYESLRICKDLDRDHDFVDYYQSIMEAREKMEET